MKRWVKLWAADARVPILRRIDMERDSQDGQHGAQQDLPIVRTGERYLDPEGVLRARYERRKRAGTLSHADIILEELAEAFDAPTPALMREELIQTAACLVKAIEALDWQQKRTEAPAAVAQISVSALIKRHDGSVHDYELRCLCGHEWAQSPIELDVARIVCPSCKCREYMALRGEP